MDVGENKRDGGRGSLSAVGALRPCHVGGEPVDPRFQELLSVTVRDTEDHVECAAAGDIGKRHRGRVVRGRPPGSRLSWRSLVHTGGVAVLLPSIEGLLAVDARRRTSVRHDEVRERPR